jgi:hypothetical protein
MTVSLCCEGPTCNAGHSATAREAAILHELPAINAGIRDEAERHARREVSRTLAVTPHQRTGVGRYQTILYACTICGYERAYGSTMWATGFNASEISIRDLATA